MEPVAVQMAPLSAVTWGTVSWGEVDGPLLVSSRIQIILELCYQRGVSDNH